MFLKPQELPAVTTAVWMNVFYFPAIRGEHLIRGARKCQPKCLNAPRPVSANPIRELHPILADDDKCTPQRPQIVTNVDRHANITGYDHRDDGHEIGRRDNPNQSRPAKYVLM